MLCTKAYRRASPARRYRGACTFSGTWRLHARARARARTQVLPPAPALICAMPAEQVRHFQARDSRAHGPPADVSRVHGCRWARRCVCTCALPLTRPPTLTLPPSLPPFRPPTLPPSRPPALPPSRPPALPPLPSCPPALPPSRPCPPAIARRRSDGDGDEPNLCRQDAHVPPVCRAPGRLPRPLWYTRTVPLRGVVPAPLR